jgi:hypothetical protein
MRKFHTRNLSAYLPMFAALLLCSWGTSVFAQSVTWQDLPWPDDQNWLGSHGSPATTNGNVITLTGQDVLSTQSFSGPLKISYNVTLPAETTTDGAFELYLVPTGSPTNLIPQTDIQTLLVFNPNEIDVQTNHGAAHAFGPVAFPTTPNTTYSNIVNIAANGVLSWSIDGQDLGLSNSVVVPYGSYQIRLSSWEPTQVWQVSDFAVVPEPTTVMLTGAGLLTLLVAFRRRR